MDSDLIICTCIIGFTAISLWILVTCIADKVNNCLFVYFIAITRHIFYFLYYCKTPDKEYVIRITIG